MDTVYCSCSLVEWRQSDGDGGPRSLLEDSGNPAMRSCMKRITLLACHALVEGRSPSANAHDEEAVGALLFLMLTRWVRVPGRGGLVLPGRTTERCKLPTNKCTTALFNALLRCSVPLLTRVDSIADVYRCVDVCIAKRMIVGMDGCRRSLISNRVTFGIGFR